MKKIFIVASINVILLNIGLAHINCGLQSNFLMKSDWLNKWSFNHKDIKYSDKKTYIYQDNKVNINLIESENNQTIAQIYAKKPQRNYYLSLSNNHFYDNNQIATYIKNKFYNDKTTKRFIPSSEYFALFDTTKEGQGKIFNNAEVNIKSAWGRTNSSESDGKIMFSLQEKTLKNHIILNEKSQFGKLRHENIEILNVKPTRLGLLPFVQILATPIGNARWTTNEISLGNSIFSQKIDTDWQNLILPEGSDSGQEWTNWFKTAASTLLGITGLLAGILATGGASIVISIATLVMAILSEISISLDSTNKTLLPPEIFQGVKDIKNIYDKVMEKSFNLYNLPEVSWENLPFNQLPTYLKGKLHGEAWSTSFWGQWSKMSLHTVWGAMNADIKYLVYNSN